MAAPLISRRTLLLATGGSFVANAGHHSQPPRQTHEAAFTHPGLLHTQDDLDRMRAAVAARKTPISNGFQAMASHHRSSPDYVIRNTGQITSWGRGPNHFAGEAADDAGAAYQNALMWCVTGDVRHADKARDILDAWSASLRTITGADGQLGAGLQGFKLANAAELLRHSGYAGWPAPAVERCEESFRTVWYPPVSGYALFANGNWDTAALQAIIAIAVFCDDPVMFEDAVRYAVAGAGNGRIEHVVVDATGQGQESGRSQAYAQLALGLLANAAAVAWNQGVDLFGHGGNRILRGYEYNARYNLGDDTVPFTPDLDRSGKYAKPAIASGNRGQFQPVYELAYAHYVSRLGLSAPHVEQVVRRGVEGGSDDHPGWGTLTQARPPATAGSSAGRSIVRRATAKAAPWRSDDIGPVATAGRTAFDGERFVLEASGTAIAGTADQFRFAHVPIRGDGTITARIVHPVSSQYACVGVMLRQSVAASSAHASMLVQGLPLHTWSGVWTVRPAAGADTTGTGSRLVPPTQQEAITINAGFPIANHGVLPRSATPLAAPYVEAASDGYRLRKPYWVRVSRSGHTFTGWVSPDGEDWTEVGSTTLRLGKDLYAGLAACSAHTETTMAAFDNVTAGRWSVQPPRTAVGELRARTGASAVELAWSDLDLAATSTVRRGRTAWGPFQTIASGVGPVRFGVETRYTDATGEPGTTYHYVVARTNVAGTGPPSAPANATMPTPAAPVVNGPTTAFANLGREFRYRTSATNDPVHFSAAGLPAGLRIDVATGVVSGTPRTRGRFAVELAARNATATGTATLTLAIADPPPAPWECTDLGEVSAPGVTSHNAHTDRFTVRGPSHYAYLPVTGDRTITTRLLTPHAGLLMTKSLSPFDQAAGVMLEERTRFVRRLRVATGPVTVESPTSVGVPVWLRLRRVGETFTAETSGDGETWTTIGEPEPIAGFGDAPYYAGLFLPSGELGSSTAVFESVSVT